MTQQEESGIVDVFKERLASPFLFTFFWVSCTWNWKIIYWFLYEPIKPSIKLEQIPFEVSFIDPLLITLTAITIVPFLNNFVELSKRFADHMLNVWLHKLKWKRMVTEFEHQKLIDEVASTKEKYHKLVDDNIKAQESERQAKAGLLSSQADANKNLEKLSELEEEKLKLITQNRELSVKCESMERHLNDVNENLTSLRGRVKDTCDLLDGPEYDSVRYAAELVKRQLEKKEKTNEVENLLNDFGPVSSNKQ